MRIAIASGKGGTGKTTVAVNLAVSLAREGQDLVLADLDVEEPNAHLFLDPQWTHEEEATLPIPQEIEGRCAGDECRQCVDLCRFKALAMMAGNLLTFPELCHGCGLCLEACPHDALQEVERVLGVVRTGGAGLLAGTGAAPLALAGGEMRVGEAMATPLIHAVKTKARRDGLELWDCPPGTACPAIASMEEADVAVLVSESTPFGLHDLVLAADTVREMGLPFGVVLNRDGMGDDRVPEWCRDENVPLLGRIPHDTRAARAYSEGKLIVDALPEFTSLFLDIFANARSLT